MVNFPEPCNAWWLLVPRTGELAGREGCILLNPPAQNPREADTKVLSTSPRGLGRYPSQPGGDAQAGAGPRVRAAGHVWAAAAEQDLSLLLLPCCAQSLASTEIQKHIEKSHLTSIRNGPCGGRHLCCILEKSELYPPEWWEGVAHMRESRAQASGWSRWERGNAGARQACTGGRRLDQKGRAAQAAAFLVHVSHARFQELLAFEGSRG